MVSDPETGLVAGYAAVQTKAEAAVTAVGKIEAKYSVKVDADNVVGGLELLAGGGRVDFGVREQLLHRSYASEQAYVDGAGNLDGQVLTVPLQGLAGPVTDHVEAWLVSAAASPFVGGTAVPAGPVDLAARKARKIAGFNAACSAQIMNGFISMSLGEPHHYPAKKQDQDNLVASVTESLIPGLPDDWTTPFWCQAVDGTWAMLPHTAAQIQQVGREGKAATLAAMSKNEQLREQVDAATDEQLDAIVW